MNPNLAWLLFEGSPFLPSLPPDSTHRVIEYSTTGHLTLCAAIAVEVASIGIRQNISHDRNFEYLHRIYGVSSQNLLIFLHGFATPSALILGGHLLRHKTLKETIQMICRPSETETLIDLNAYKARHLLTAGDICLASSGRPPVVCAASIYDLCRRDPFGSDQYFLVGLEASEITFQKLAAAHDFLAPHAPL